jgi:hypothetical protein
MTVIIRTQMPSIAIIRERDDEKALRPSQQGKDKIRIGMELNEQRNEEGGVTLELFQP